MARLLRLEIPRCRTHRCAWLWPWQVDETLNFEQDLLKHVDIDAITAPVGATQSVCTQVPEVAQSSQDLLVPQVAQVGIPQQQQQQVAQASVLQQVQPRVPQAEIPQQTQQVAQALQQVQPQVAEAEIPQQQVVRAEVLQPQVQAEIPQQTQQVAQALQPQVAEAEIPQQQVARAEVLQPCAQTQAEIPQQQQQLVQQGAQAAVLQQVQAEIPQQKQQVAQVGIPQQGQAQAPVLQQVQPQVAQAEIPQQQQQVVQGAQQVQVQQMQQPQILQAEIRQAQPEVLQGQHALKLADADAARQQLASQVMQQATPQAHAVQQQAQVLQSQMAEASSEQAKQAQQSAVPQQAQLPQPAVRQEDPQQVQQALQPQSGVKQVQQANIHDMMKAAVASGDFTPAVRLVQDVVRLEPAPAPVDLLAQQRLQAKYGLTAEQAQKELQKVPLTEEALRQHNSDQISSADLAELQARGWGLSLGAKQAEQDPKPAPVAPTPQTVQVKVENAKAKAESAGRDFNQVKKLKTFTFGPADGKEGKEEEGPYSRRAAANLIQRLRNNPDRVKGSPALEKMVFDDDRKSELISILVDEKGNLEAAQAVCMVMAEEVGENDTFAKRAQRWTKKQMENHYGEEADRVMKRKTELGHTEVDENCPDVTLFLVMLKEDVHEEFRSKSHLTFVWTS